MEENIDEQSTLLQNESPVSYDTVYRAGNIKDEYSHQHNGSYNGPSNTEQETKNALKVYKRRWYILLIFGIMAFIQGWGWNTWGPIAASSKYAFGWSNSHIALLAFWGPVMYMISVFGWSWLMQRKGLRWACLLSATCLLFGAGIRCISVEPPLVTWLMNVGQIGYSLAGPVSMAGSSVVSATWFPPSQRVTATAIMSRIMAVGGTATYIWGPRFVRDVTGMNVTSLNHTVEAQLIRHDIQIYMYIELGFATLVFLALLIYFPAKPPTPPSLSTSATQHVTFRTGMKQVIRHHQFWLLAIPYSLSYGVYIGWMANLDVLLQPLDISQVETGLLAFVGMIIGSIVSLITARLVDKLSGRTKPTLVVLYMGAVAGSLVFALVYIKIIPFNLVNLYIPRIIGAICLSSLPPLVFEVLNETTYPVPTTVNNGMVTFLKNFCVLLFLVILIIPGVGTSWMNWFMVGSATICIPMVLIFKEKHNRLKVDEDNKEDENGDRNINADVR